MPYIVEPAWFKAEGALIDWVVVAARLKMPYSGPAGTMLHLRWMLHKDLGMPTEPFIVWRKPRASGGPSLKQLTITTQPAEYLFGDFLVTWTEGSMCRVVVETTSNSGGTLIAFTGSPTFGSSMTMLSVGSGNATTIIESTEIDGLIVTKGVSVTKVSGIHQDVLAQESGWSQVEVVGLPVVSAEWAGVGKYATTKQGLMTALTDPGSAAVQRLQRGGPKVGWQTMLPTGESAPLWTAPNAGALVSEVRTELLGRLKKAMQNAVPNQQAAFIEEVSLPPITNPNTGKVMTGGQPGKSKAAPLTLTLMGASSDPWLALVLGFGTALNPAREAKDSTTGVVMNNAFDYMITARWEKGLDGVSAPIDMAALVPAPGSASGVPVPANIVPELMGYVRPIAPDKEWRCSVKCAWDRPADIEISRPRSSGFVRVGVSPTETVRPLMDQRLSGGFRYPMINSAQITPLPPDWWQVSAVDRELPIPLSPGQRTVRYGICQQDIYGQWSQWAKADMTVHQPPLDPVRLVSAALVPQAPSDPLNPVCPATLTIEFMWDWRIRRPSVFRFVGRLYATPKKGAPPPNTNVPAILERKLDHSGSLLQITFNGDVPSGPPGVILIPLSADGEKQVTWGAAQGNETRRCRMTVPGFELNYANTPHAGLAIWAQAKERAAPLRTNDWSEHALVITASDPRPPVMTPDVVDLASLPDAAGQCHARLSWGTNSQGAAASGYFIYESTETKLLQAAGQPEPLPEMTLSDRLAVLNLIFEDPNISTKDLFIRRNEKPSQASSADVTLPKGSTTIHLFVIIGVNAGQVEAVWPSGVGSHNAMQAVATPILMKPAPPTLEVRPVLDKDVNPPVYRAEIIVGARPGPRVNKVELFRVRVDDAAKELDTMGPPIAAITGSGSGWDVMMQNDSYGQSISALVGKDTPSGSWKRVWYRVAGWSDNDNLRGRIKGRSLPSSPAWCVVPPPTAPDLSPITVSWPGGSLADVQLNWTSMSPVRKTPIGPHTLNVRADVVPALPPGTEPLLTLSKPVHLLPDDPPVGKSGVYVTNPSGPKPYHYVALLRRASENDALQVAIRLADPIGRTSEQLVTVAAGPVLPAPDVKTIAFKASAHPVGTLLKWTSAVPLDTAAPYMVRVAAFRPLQSGQQIQTQLVLQLSAPDIPIDEPGPIPPGLDPLRIRRNAGGGPVYSYYAFCRVSVQRFVLRITSPDGKTVEQTQIVS